MHITKYYFLYETFLLYYEIYYAKIKISFQNKKNRIHNKSSFPDE